LFSSEIQLEINNRVGVLAAVASSVAGTETNIDQVSLEERDVSSSSLKFLLQVRDRKHLALVIRTIRRMPDVRRVHRTLT
jgi:(p)ppGpp synthase/HD superfamily hydrolase